MHITQLVEIISCILYLGNDYCTKGVGGPEFKRSADVEYHLEHMLWNHEKKTNAIVVPNHKMTAVPTIQQQQPVVNLTDDNTVLLNNNSFILKVVDTITDMGNYDDAADYVTEDDDYKDEDYKDDDDDDDKNNNDNVVVVDEVVTTTTPSSLDYHKSAWYLCSPSLTLPAKDSCIMYELLFYRLQYCPHRIRNLRLGLKSRATIIQSLLMIYSSRKFVSDVQYGFKSFCYGGNSREEGVFSEKKYIHVVQQYLIGDDDTATATITKTPTTAPPPPPPPSNVRTKEAVMLLPFQKVSVNTMNLVIGLLFYVFFLFSLRLWSNCKAEKSLLVYNLFAMISVILLIVMNEKLYGILESILPSSDLIMSILVAILYLELLCQIVAMYRRRRSYNNNRHHHRNHHHHQRLDDNKCSSVFYITNDDKVATSSDNNTATSNSDDKEKLVGTKITDVVEEEDDDDDADANDIVVVVKH